MGAFACLAPRVVILAVPWIWSLCNGRWSLRFLATEEWHHVRYTVLPVAMILAAGVIGYARLGAWLKACRGGWFVLVLVWLVAALAGGLGLRELSARMSCIPRPISDSRSRRHLVLDPPGRARGGRPGRLRGDRAAFIPQAALQLCPRAEQAPRLPPARPRVPVDLSPQQGSRSQGLSRPGLRRRLHGRFHDSLAQGIAIQEGTLNESFRLASVSRPRRAGCPWSEQMDRKMLRNVEKRGVHAARNAPSEDTQTPADPWPLVLFGAEQRESLRRGFGRLRFGRRLLAGQLENLAESVVAGGGAGFGEPVEQCGEVHALDLVRGRGRVRRSPRAAAGGGGEGSEVA